MKFSEFHSPYENLRYLWIIFPKYLNLHYLSYRQCLRACRQITALQMSIQLEMYARILSYIFRYCYKISDTVMYFKFGTLRSCLVVLLFFYCVSSRYSSSYHDNIYSVCFVSYIFCVCPSVLSTVVYPTLSRHTHLH